VQLYAYTVYLAACAVTAVTQRPAAMEVDIN